MASSDLNPFSLDFHLKCVKLLCRVCTNRAQKGKELQQKNRPVKHCVNYKEDILEVYAIDISDDGPETHSDKICDRCYRKIINFKRGSSKRENKKQDSQFWTKHRSSHCNVCELFSNQKKGGAPKKIMGRPKTIPANLHFNHRSDDTFAELNSSLSSAECSTQNIEIVVKQKRNNGGKISFQCNECDKAFTHSPYLVQHKRIHSGGRPFRCKECDKAFIDSSGLIKHERIHSGERPFQCNDCDKAFIDSAGLVKHKRIHSGERPFQCDESNKAFPHPSGLVQHISTQTAGSPLQCDKTNETSYLKQCEKTHQMRSTHKIEPSLSEPRQWVVIEGQCVPVKQEFEQNTSSILEKQDNHVVRGQCLPIKQELKEENASSILEKQDNLVTGQCLPIKQELEEGNASSM